MSTAVQTPTPVKPAPRGKPDAEQRISQLVREAKDLEAKLEAALRENESLLDRLAAFEAAGVDIEEYKRLKAAETARLEEERAAMSQFIALCDAAARSIPGFDECLRRISGVPASWLRELTQHPNPLGMVVFLGTEPCAFLQYLFEVKEEVAIRRLRQAGYEAKLPKFPQEVINGNR
jgi:hypothetical protein